MELSQSLFESEEKQVNSSATPTVIEFKKSDPIRLEIEVTPTSWIQRKKIELGISKPKQVIELPSTVIGTLYHLSTLILSLDHAFRDNATIKEIENELVIKNADKLAQIIAIASRNSRGKYSNKLLRFIKAQLSPEDLIKAYSLVLHQMQLDKFMLAIYVIRGANVLSPRISEESFTPNPINA